VTDHDELLESLFPHRQKHAGVKMDDSFCPLPLHINETPARRRIKK